MDSNKGSGEDYHHTVARQIETIRSVNRSLFNLLDDPLPYHLLWEAAIGAQVEVVRALPLEALRLNPPLRFQDFHQKLVVALWLFACAVQDISYAIRQGYDEEIFKRACKRQKQVGVLLEDLRATLH